MPLRFLTFSDLRSLAEGPDGAHETATRRPGDPGAAEAGRSLVVFALVLASTFLLAGPASAQAPAAGWMDLDPVRFPVPAELQDNVAFWTKVYTG